MGYEEPHDNLYPHHDIPLPVFPLCLAWLDCRPLNRLQATTGPSSACNMIAVGTFAPQIEVWDLDVLDALEPVAVLGAEGSLAAMDADTAKAAEAMAAQGRGGGGEAAGKKKKKKKKAATAEGHT